MASHVQPSSVPTNKGFIVSGRGVVKRQTIVTNGARATVLKKYTVMAQLASGEKWTPFVALNLTTGASIPKGIYMGEDIAAATLAAADVTDAPILIGQGCTVDGTQIVLDDSTLAKTSICNPSNIEARTAEMALRDVGIIIEDTNNLDEFA